MFGRTIEDVGEKYEKFAEKYVSSEHKIFSKFGKYDDKVAFAFSSLFGSKSPQIIPEENLTKVLSFDEASAQLADFNKHVVQGGMSLNDYFEQYQKGNTVLKDYVTKTEQQTQSTQGLIKESEKARNAQIAQNEQIKNSTLAAQAHTLALKASSMALNMLTYMFISQGIQMIIKGIGELNDDYADLEDRIESLKSTYSKQSQSIEEINDKISKNKELIEDIVKLDTPTYVDLQDLENLRTQNALLKENLELTEKAKEGTRQKMLSSLKKKIDAEFFSNEAEVEKKTDITNPETAIKNIFTFGMYNLSKSANLRQADSEYEKIRTTLEDLEYYYSLKDSATKNGGNVIDEFGNVWNLNELEEKIKSYESVLQKHSTTILSVLDELSEYDPDYEDEYTKTFLRLNDEITRFLDFDTFVNGSIDKIIADNRFNEIGENIKKSISSGLIDEDSDLLSDEDARKLVKYVAMTIYDSSDDESLKKAASHIFNNLKENFEEEIEKYSYSPADIFALEDSEGELTKLGEYSEQLDKIQEAYDALTEACENYQENGYITIDQLQALLSNGSRFLDYLVDEEGNLRTDTEAMENLAKARLIEMEAKIQQGLIDNVTSIQAEGDETAYLASTNYELAESYRDVAAASLEAWQKTSLANGMSQTTIDKIMNKYNADSKKVRDLFNNVNIASLSSSSSSGSSSSSSSSKDKDAVNDIIDFAEYRLEELNSLINDTKENIEQLEGSLAKNTLTDGLININKNKIDTLESVSRLYQQMADRYLVKIPDTYRELAKDGGINITEFIGDGNSELAETIENYRDWADKVSDVNSQLLELQQTLKDLQSDKFNNIKEEFDSLTDIVDKNKSQINDVIDLLETQGKTVGVRFYEELIDETDTQLALLHEERDRLNEQMNSALANGITMGSDEWNDMYDSLKDVDSSIISCRKDISEFQKSIDELHWDTVEDIADSFSQLDSEIGNIIDLLNTDIVTTDNGEWNNEALTNLGLLAQQYELAKNKAEMYSEQISYLTDQYNKGKVSQNDYYEKLYELQDAQWDSIKTYEEAKNAVIELNRTRIDEAVEAINEEIDAYDEMIQRQKDALTAEKELNDYKRSISEKEKDIAETRRKINAMLGSDDASTIAEREKLEAELAEKLSDLENFKYEHSIEVQQEALDKELEAYKKTQEDRIEILEDSLKDEEKLMSDSFKSVKKNTEIIAGQLETVARTHGITISNTIIKPWESGANAIAYYGSSLTSQTSVFQSQLNGIKTNLWNVQTQADNTADSLMNALSINNASVNNTLNTVRNSLSGAVSWADQLKNSLMGAINTNYGDNAVKSINSIKSSAESAYNAIRKLSDVPTSVENRYGLKSPGGTVIGYYSDENSAMAARDEFNNNPSNRGQGKASVVRLYAKGGIIKNDGKENPFAKAFGEDTVVVGREGERILTPVQNENFEKLVNLMPNLVPVMNNMLPDIDYGKLVPQKADITPVINIDAGITVQGSIDRSFAKDFEDMQNQLTKNVTGKIANSLTKLGIQKNCCRPL